MWEVTTNQYTKSEKNQGSISQVIVMKLHGRTDGSMARTMHGRTNRSTMQKQYASLTLLSRDKKGKRNRGAMGWEEEEEEKRRKRDLLYTMKSAK